MLLFHVTARTFLPAKVTQQKHRNQLAINFQF